MARVKYQPDFSGIRALAKGPEMQKAMLQIGGNAKDYAVKISPKRSGEYSRSFDVQPTLVPVTWRKEMRASAKLINTAPHAAAVEWKNGDRVLRRTAGYVDDRVQLGKGRRGGRAKP